MLTFLYIYILFIYLFTDRYFYNMYSCVYIYIPIHR